MIDVFDGRGGRWEAEVLGVRKKGTDIRLGSRCHVPPPTADLWLAPALIKASAFEMILEKAVEIGVTRILPFRAARSNIGDRDREARWSRILVEAAKQSKRYHLPVLEPACGFDDVLRAPAASRFFFDEASTSALGHDTTSAPALVVIGPEGGWTDEERERARSAGFETVGLGSHILRSETAAIVATALVAHHLGVF
jgi:16S rRNA (uracil1498-N3)-methyltransferase